MPATPAAKDFGVDRATLETAVIAEQFRLLTHKRIDLPINLLNAGLVCGMFWPLYPVWVTAAWLGTFCLITLMRFLTRRRYRTAGPGTMSPRSWGLVFTLNAFVSASMWGMTGSVVLLTPDPVRHLFIVFVLGGMMAGGVVSNAAYKPAMLAFLVPIVLPIVAILLSRPDLAQVEMGVMLVLFTLLLAATGRDINRAIVENLRLRIGQDFLLARLRTSEATMAESQAIAQIGSWSFDTRTNIGTWSAEAYRIFGADPATFVPSYDAILARVHPDDRAVLAVAFTVWGASRSDKATEHRLLMDDGTIKWLHAIGRAHLDAAGRVTTLHGTMQDITARRLGDEKLQFANSLLTAQMEAAPDGILVANAGGRMIVCNQRLLDMWNMTRASVGAGDATALLGRVAAAARDPAAFAARMAYLFAHPLEATRDEFETRDGRSFERYTVALTAPDATNLGRVWSFRDITERKQGDTSRALLAAIVESSGDAIAAETVDGTITSWNRAAERLFGYPAEEIIGSNVRLLVPAGRRAEVEGNLGQLARGEYIAPFDTERRRKDGTLVPVSIALSAIRDAAGAVVGGSFISRDITLRKTAEHELLLANLLLKTQMEASPDAILVVDADQRITSYNQRFADMWPPLQPMLAAGDNAVMLARAAPTFREPEKFAARVRYLDEHPRESGQDELEMADGRFFDRHTVPLIMPDGKLFGRIWFFRDMTESKRAAALALRTARLDGLTGLPNRGVFVEALQQALVRAKRDQKGFALIYLDLDHFKDVNDTLGRPAGDALLEGVAARLRANTRATDTLARFGGDEFAAIVGEVAEVADVVVVVDKLVAALREPFSIMGNDIFTDASIGIDMYGPDSADAESLLAHADVALYCAKADGRGTYRFFTGAMGAEVRTRVTLGEELRKAIDGNQFFLLYQPQVLTGTGQIVGLEALIRWRHPTRGIVAPDTFIPVAERTGMIGNLGHWVLWEACRQARAWRDAGVPPMRIAVNVSALQFRAPLALEADIAAALAANGLATGALELELTESALISASREHDGLVQRLRRTGVTIAIDDFGTGYSSLDYLRRFPADRIKIAQGFVRHIETMQGDVVIVKATIGLAHALGIAVIAEGVETRAQFELLKNWGCGEIQGYYFAKPLAPDTVARLLRAGGVIDPLAAVVA